MKELCLIDGDKKCANPSCSYVGLNFHKGSYYCKPCANQRTRLWHENNKNNPDVKRRKRNSWIKTTHNISLEEYELKLKAQNYRCAICNLTLKSEGHMTHLDHNHETGKLRQFLCTNCNRGLGHFQDSKQLLLKAAEYLDSHTEDGNQKEGRRL
jgi:hypothetical protein